VNGPEYHPKAINLGDVPLTDPERQRAVEVAYHRGVDYALKFAGPSVHNGAKADHLDALVELAVQIRHDQENCHSCRDALRHWWQATEKGAN